MKQNQNNKIHGVNESYSQYLDRNVEFVFKWKPNHSVAKGHLRLSYLGYLLQNVNTSAPV